MTNADLIYSEVRKKFSTFPDEISWDEWNGEVRASFSVVNKPCTFTLRLDTSGRVIGWEVDERPEHTFSFKNGHSLKPKTPVVPKPERVIFNNPATIAFWPDGTKTVVKCGPNDLYDPEKGLAMCIAKRFYGTSESKGNYYDVFHEFLDNENNFKKET